MITTVDRPGWLGSTARRLVVPGAVLCLGMVAAFAALLYAMPADFTSDFGGNPEGAAHFRGILLGQEIGFRVGRVTFSIGMGCLMAGAWAAYLLTMAAGVLGGVPTARWLRPLVGAAVVGVAVGCPPALSHDVYAYVGHARLPWLHRLNPYTVPLTELRDLGDETARFVGTCDMPSVYGPIWTWLSIALVASLTGAGLWLQIVAMKLLAALALVAAASMARLLADRDRDGRGDLTYLAFTLNPLLLIEGPAGGHNDLVMMALMLGAVVLYSRNRTALGDLVLGIAIGVKFLPAAVLPWLCLERVRAVRPGVALVRAMATPIVALAPLTLAYAPFWSGEKTFQALDRRAGWGASGEVWDVLPVAKLTSTGVPEWASRFTVHLLLRLPILEVYIGLTAWIAWSGRPGRWLDAWVIFSLILALWGTAVRFPWYMAWPLTIALTRRGRLGCTLAVVSLVCSICLMLGYCRIG
ncbi:MAG: hypothetical protein ACP5XB_17070 [Isosphaeraceae bacterium]